MDRFGQDTYGHSAGDAALREVANRLEASSEGTFIPRFGGDEFALIVADDADFVPSKTLASRILAVVRPTPRVPTFVARFDLTSRCYRGLLLRNKRERST